MRTSNEAEALAEKTGDELRKPHLAGAHIPIYHHDGQTWDSCLTERLEVFLGLPNALKAHLAAQHNHGFK